MKIFYDTEFLEDGRAQEDRAFGRAERRLRERSKEVVREDQGYGL